MTEAEFLAHVQDYRDHYPEQRYGQAVFNMLHNVYPEIADDLRGTEFDPYHRDDRVPFTLAFMAEWLREEAEDAATVTHRTGDTTPLAAVENELDLNN